jgi:hypothetical protein
MDREKEGGGYGKVLALTGFRSTWLRNALRLEYKVSTCCWRVEIWDIICLNSLRRV